MKAIVVEDVGKLKLSEVPEPTLQKDEVLVKVKYCGICGTDLHGINSGLIMPGMIVGHEFSGEVVDAGKDVKDFKVGDKVVGNSIIPCMHCEYCRRGQIYICDEIGIVGITTSGAMAEYIAIRKSALFKIPEGVTLKRAAILEPLSIALKGVLLSNFKLSDKVLIIGGGPLGIFVLQLLSLQNKADQFIFISEINPKRIEIIKRLSSAVIINPSKEPLLEIIDKATKDKGVDLVYECVGIPKAIQDGIELVKKNGQIIVMGVFSEMVALDILRLFMKDITLKPSFGNTEQTFKIALELLESGRLDVDPVITSEVGLFSAIEDGFYNLMAKDTKDIKILVNLERRN